MTTFQDACDRTKVQINDIMDTLFRGDKPYCDGCSVRFNIVRRKKVCTFCKCYYCSLCIVRRSDKKLCCKKCQILTARPLDRAQLLKLRNRDLLNYLTSRHIPITGCVEKEDLVNALVRAVNNSSFHPSNMADSCTSQSASYSGFNTNASTYSYPNSPRRRSFNTGSPCAERKQAQSVGDIPSHDGIRVTPLSSEDSHSLDGIHVFPNESSNGDVESTSVDFEVINISDVEDAECANVPEPPVDHKGTTSTDQSQNKPVEIQKGPEQQCWKPLMLSDINSKEDLDALSIKQLKELLMRNRMDYRGCVERAELLERVNRLWQDYIISRKDVENLGIDELCKICMDAPIECVLLECGHMGTCTNCGKQLSECPICRQYVVRCVRIFKA